nr:MAK10-like protein [Tanacetum cinerariifolium]
MEATKSQPSSKEAAHLHTSHLKRKKRPGTAKDKEPIQPSGSTIVDTKLYKEDLQTAEPEDSVATIKRRRHDIHGNDIRDSATVSGHGRLKEDLEPSTWQRCQERTIDQSASGKLYDRNAKKSWALLEDLALYDIESSNDPRDLAKPVKAITLPKDVLSTSDRYLIELENQVQRLMKAHLAMMQPTQVNKITTSCEICSGPYDTQYYMKDRKQAFVEYVNSRADRMGSRQFTTNQGPRSFNEATNSWKENLKFNWAHAQTFTSPQNGSFSIYSSNYQTKLEKTLIDFDVHQKKRLSSLRIQLEQQQDDMISKINLLRKALRMKPRKKAVLSLAKLSTQTMKMQMKLIKKLKAKRKSGRKIKERPKKKRKITRNTSTPSHYERVKVMSNRLEPRRKPSNPKKNCNFVGRVKGLRVFVVNFTYKCDFMVLEDTTSVINHYLGSVLFRKPFMEATRLAYNKEEGTIVFERDKEMILFKMPHKMDKFKHVIYG